MVIVVIGAMFSLLFAVNLIIAGVRRNAEELAERGSGGETLVMVTKKVECATVECEVPEVDEEEAREIIQKYGGKVIAEVGLEGIAYSLPEEMLRKAIEVPVETVPDGVRIKVTSLSNASLRAMVPIPEGTNVKAKLEAVERIQEKVVGKIRETSSGEEMIVGILPYALVLNLSLENVGDKWNPLNMVLDKVKTVNEYGEFYVRRRGEEAEKVVGLVASFGEVSEAYKYMRDDTNYDSDLDDSYKRAEFEVREILGSGVETYVQTEILQIIVNLVSAGLAVVAAVVLITTVVRLVGQEKRTVWLYRAMGATKREIILVYFLYVMELCVLAVGLALLVAVVVALGMSWFNEGNLETVVELGYGVKDYRMVLLGWNEEMWWLMGSVFGAGAMGVIMSDVVVKS